jgi:hypothetical protein
MSRVDMTVSAKGCFGSLDLEARLQQHDDFLVIRP